MMEKQFDTTYTPEIVWGMIAELTKNAQETDRKLDKISKMVSGIGQNNGDMAETYFFSRLSKKLNVGSIDYDMVEKNMERHTKKLQGEYDIVLINSHKVLVIEVKYKLHPEDVTRFTERKLPKFKQLFPEYKDYEIVAGVAGMTIPDDSLNLAIDSGLLVMTQTGDDISIINEDDLANNKLKKW